MLQHWGVKSCAKEKEPDAKDPNLCECIDMCNAQKRQIHREGVEVGRRWGSDCSQLQSFLWVNESILQAEREVVNMKFLYTCKIPKCVLLTLKLNT